MADNQTPMAFNKETGSALFLGPDGEWSPAQTAVNPQTGEKLFFDGAGWRSPPVEPKTAMQRAVRGTGIAGRTAIQGLGSIPGLVYDTFKLPFDAGRAAYNAATGNEGGYIPSGSSYIKSGLDAVGLPEAETDAEKLVSAGGEAAFGGLPGLGVATSVAGKVAGPVKTAIVDALRTAPVLQTVSGGVGGVAGEKVKQEGGGPGAQIAGSLAAGITTAGGMNVARNAITDGAKRLVQGLTGVTTADRKVAAILTEKGNGNLQEGIRLAAKEIAENPDSALVDVLGMRGERLARVAANVDGEGANLAEKFITERIAGRGDRMQTAADQLAPRGFHDDLDALKTSQRAAGNPLYEEAFSTPYVWDQRIQDLAEHPSVRAGIKKGLSIISDENMADGVKFDPTQYSVTGFTEAGDPILGKVNNLRVLDAGKRGLDEIINEARDPITGKIQWTEALRAKDKLRAALVAKLDEATTDAATGQSVYKNARASWAGPAKIEDAMWLGRRFLRGDEEITGKNFAALSEGEKEAFKSGVRRELVDTINSDTQRAPLKFSAVKAGLWKKIENFFPPEDVAEFRRSTQAELGKMRTERFVAPRIGSQTTPLAQDMKELNTVNDVIPELALNGATGNVTGIIRALMSPVAKAFGPSKKTAEDLARILMELDPEKQQTVMRNLQQSPRLTGINPKMTSDEIRNLVRALSMNAPIQQGMRDER